MHVLPENHETSYETLIEANDTSNVPFNYLWRSSTRACISLSCHENGTDGAADCIEQIKKTTKELFLEVTSSDSLQTCKDVMDCLIVVRFLSRVMERGGKGVHV